MAQDEFVHLHGKEVTLAGDLGPFRRCRCGCNRAIIGPGISTHPAKLKCTDCTRFLGWVGRNHLIAISDSMQPQKRRRARRVG